MTPQTEEVQRYPIVKGPGKFDVMLSLFEGKIVSFTIRTPDNRDLEVWGRIKMVESLGNISTETIGIRLVTLTGPQSMEGFDDNSRQMAGPYSFSGHKGADNFSSPPRLPQFDHELYRSITNQRFSDV